MYGLLGYLAEIQYENLESEGAKKNNNNKNKLLRQLPLTLSFLLSNAYY